MTRPGIEPSNDNRVEAAGIAPANAPKKKGCLKWALAGAALAGAGLLALSQCSEEPQETPVPQAPKAPEAPAYQYDLSENTPLQTEDGQTVVVERRSCLLSAGGNKVNYGAEGGIEVVATEEGTGVKATGYISPNNLGNLYGPGACTATFLRAAPAETPITTDGPQAFWRVSFNGANLYETPDITTPIAHAISEGSCVTSTGKIRGDLMEVTINAGKYTFWTPRENYTPAPSHIDAPTCQAKM